MECLGCIPERPKLSHVELGQCVLAERDDQIMESFRVVYGAADLHSRVAFPKAIVTTSTGPSEGKSFVTANMAATYARHGKRVIVIDGDFRKPSQHKLIGAKNEAGTLKWFRAGGKVPESVEELIEDVNLGLLPLSEDHDIFLLRAGGSTRNPSEIISSKRFEALVNNLRNWFDVVMIDSPPVGLLPDALFLANYAEEALFVCKHNGLNRHKIKFALSKMQGGPAVVLGTIMNQLSASKRHQYGYGYKDYGYGSYSDKDYANYYHAEEDEDENENEKS
jgi:succinoglycan biosynthesis transport protein ExoP